MAASLQGHQVHPEGRTWKTHFPKGDLWVFGYGSLIWKPPPHYDQRVPGYISGYVRRFWQSDPKLTFARVAFYFQASTDHRGTPEQPGRVVTVIERKFWETLDDPLAKLESQSESTGKVWGAAYHIPASHAEEVHDYLDEHSICMVYIGQPTNPQFLRERAQREPQNVAQVISAGHGLSGKNSEYLFLLEKALEGIGLGSADVHVTDLVKRVKAIEAEGEGDREELKAEREVKLSLASHEEVAHGDNIE
ncbi:hypothetical protein N7513_006469 [Penicillium frequentans]|nr:hypothetical protein N7513_006469 [Penicillium glabrum]